MKPVHHFTRAAALAVAALPTLALGVFVVLADSVWLFGLVGLAGGLFADYLHRHGVSWWRSGLPLALDRYDDERYEDIRSAAQTVLARRPTAPAAAPAPLYEPAEQKKELPAGVPTVFGLCGKPRAGKDVVADYLVAHYKSVERFAYSDAIRDEVNEYLAHHRYRFGGGHHVVTETNKSESHYRHLLQAWGMARRTEDPGYWVAQVKAKIRARLQNGARLVIATGARVPTDVEVIHELGGEVLRVVRPGNTYQAEHEVESALDHLPDDAFVTIENPVEGDLAPYEAAIEAMLTASRSKRTAAS